MIADESELFDVRHSGASVDPCQLIVEHFSSTVLIDSPAVWPFWSWQNGIAEPRCVFAARLGMC